MKEYLPQEYLEFLEKRQQRYSETNLDIGIEFEPKETIEKFNRDIEIGEYASGFYAFASDGGNEVFAFDNRGKVYLLPLIGMSPESAHEIASSWPDFVKRVLVNA